jgi:hypothetical protein
LGAPEEEGRSALRERIFTCARTLDGEGRKLITAWASEIGTA